MEILEVAYLVVCFVVGGVFLDLLVMWFITVGFTWDSMNKLLMS